jgi:hypothetical protein
MLTKTSLIVQERICEVEVAVSGTIVEFYGHCVMGVLVDCPDEAGQVQAHVTTIASPRGATRLEGIV